MYIATLVEGLGHNSRVITKISGFKAPLNEIIMAGCVDALNLLVWTKSKDAVKGKNKPNSILESLLSEPKEKEIQSFETADDFERMKKEILQGGN